MSDSVQNQMTRKYGELWLSYFHPTLITANQRTLGIIKRAEWSDRARPWIDQNKFNGARIEEDNTLPDFHVAFKCEKTEDPERSGILILSI